MLTYSEVFLGFLLLLSTKEKGAKMVILMVFDLAVLVPEVVLSIVLVFKIPQLRVLPSRVRVPGVFVQLRLIPEIFVVEV